MTYSFHVLIATIGKKSIFNQLDSLIHQLCPKDYLTIVFDNKDIDNVFQEVSNYQFSCNYNVIMEPNTLGSFGHGIRNKYNILEGDFIMHADDDDLYADDAFSKIRKLCKDKDTLYIFKICGFWKSELEIIPKTDKIKYGNISTQCGVIPKDINHKSNWGDGYGGDACFYIELTKHAINIKFYNDIIYYYRQDQWYNRFKPKIEKKRRIYI